MIRIRPTGDNKGKTQIFDSTEHSDACRHVRSDASYISKRPFVTPRRAGHLHAGQGEGRGCAETHRPAASP